VTGYCTAINTDIATIKYSPNGVQRWLAIYNGLGNDADEGDALTVDDSGYVYVTGYSAVSSTNTDMTTIKYVQGPQGIEETRQLLVANRLRLEVYPNPAKTYFAIRLPQSADHSLVKIFDIAGNIVKSEELKGKNNRISLDGIKNGVYFVKIGYEMVKEKLVVTK
jgi:hypothetical protein